MNQQVVLETLIRDRQARYLEAAARSRRTPARPHLSSAMRDWGRWWFAGRTLGGPTEPPTAAHDGYLTSPG